MSTNVFENNVLTSVYPVIENVYDLFDNVQGFFNKLNVDDGTVLINQSSHNDNVQDAHIFLKGQLQSHEAYVKIHNAQGAELFRIDYLGKLIAPMDVVCPSITAVLSAAAVNTAGLTTLENSMITSFVNMDTKIINLEAITNAATAAAVDDTLVLRDNTNGTWFTQLNAILINVLGPPGVGANIAMYGDANLYWQPQTTVNGVLTNIVGSFVRVGRTNAIGGGNVGDGIELAGLPMPDGSAPNNVLISANSTAASINLQCNKTNTAPYISCSNKDDVVQNTISEQGFSQLYKHAYPIIQLTPGNVETPVLFDSLRRYTFQLATDWINSADEIILVFQRSFGTDDEESRFFQCEVFIDESNVESGYIDSMIYVDRVMKNVRKNVPSIVRVTLKMQLFNSETNIPTGTTITLTMNNQKMLEP